MEREGRERKEREREGGEGESSDRRGDVNMDPLKLAQ